MNLTLAWRCLCAVAIASLTLSAVSVEAGGPLKIGGPKFGMDGQPFVWDNTKPIQYWTDGGPLGSLSNSDANAMVAQAFQAWAQVPTASLSFARAGSIGGVAGGDVSTVSDFDTVLGTCNSGSQTPIIYDNGSLLLQLTGDNSVVGLSGLCLLSTSGRIQSAFALIGNPSFLQSNLLPAVMSHEFGHLIGMGHTDIPSPSSTGTTQADVDATPTMTPVLFTPLQSSPKVDDVAWVSKLYPSASYASSYGMITGQVLFSDGKYPVQGALIVARNINDIHVTVVSCVAGYRFTTNPGQPYTANYLPCTPSSACPNGTLGYNSVGSQFGSRDPSMIGFYEVPVPPGQYNVEVHSLLTDFSGFFDPVAPRFPLPGPSGNTPGTVTTAASAIVSGINIILNGTDPPFDIFEHSQSGSARNTRSPEHTLYAWRNEKRVTAERR